VAACAVGCLRSGYTPAGLYSSSRSVASIEEGSCRSGDGNLTQSQGDYGVIASCDKRIVGVCV
jgi:hypothetical protein